MQERPLATGLKRRYFHLYTCQCHITTNDVILYLMNQLKYQNKLRHYDVIRCQVENRRVSSPPALTRN